MVLGYAIGFARGQMSRTTQLLSYQNHQRVKRPSRIWPHSRLIFGAVWPWMRSKATPSF